MLQLPKHYKACNEAGMAFVVLGRQNKCEFRRWFDYNQLQLGFGPVFKSQPCW